MKVMFMPEDLISVSIIIPVYNGEKYLSEAIESILIQSYKPFEIIIIDDGSNDATAQVVKKYNSLLRYLYQENKGIAAARNRGVSEAKGNYICFLDADDIWPQYKLQKQIDKLLQDKSIDIIFGMVKHFFSPETDEDFRKSVRLLPDPLPGILPGTMLIKRKTFLKVGVFSTDYKIGEFIEWYIRAKENNLKIFCIPEILLKRRMHYDNYTLINKNLKKDYARIIRDKIIKKKTTYYGKH